MSAGLSRSGHSLSFLAVFLSRRPGASGPRVGVDGIFGSTCSLPRAHAELATVRDINNFR